MFFNLSTTWLLSCSVHHYRICLLSEFHTLWWSESKCQSWCGGVPQWCLLMSAHMMIKISRRESNQLFPLGGGLWHIDWSLFFERSLNAFSPSMSKGSLAMISYYQCSHRFERPYCSPHGWKHVWTSRITRSSSVEKDLYWHCSTIF